MGYPKEWEKGQAWNGGWVRKRNGTIEPGSPGRSGAAMRIFANPNLPQIDDYYEPFTFDYDPPAVGARMTPPHRAAALADHRRGWKDHLGSELGEIPRRWTESVTVAGQANFDECRRRCTAVRNTFMIYLPRLCEHCLNPACAASCPSA